MKKRELAPLIPPDPKQCQAEKPNGHSFMTLGGVPGRARCESELIVIATETKPSDDGRRGWMSLCGSCMEVMQRQLGAGFCTFSTITREPSPEQASKRSRRS